MIPSRFVDAFDTGDGGTVGLEAGFYRGGSGGLEFPEGAGEVIPDEGDFLFPFAVDHLLRRQPRVVAQDEAGMIADVDGRAVIVHDLMPSFASRRTGEISCLVRHGLHCRPSCLNSG